MEWIKLIGILIIIIGFILKFDTIAIILIAAVTTGLVAGMDIVEVLSTLGKSLCRSTSRNAIYAYSPDGWFD